MKMSGSTVHIRPRSTPLCPYKQSVQEVIVRKVLRKQNVELHETVAMYIFKTPRLNFAIIFFNICPQLPQAPHMNKVQIFNILFFTFAHICSQLPTAAHSSPQLIISLILTMLLYTSAYSCAQLLSCPQRSIATQLIQEQILTMIFTSVHICPQLPTALKILTIIYLKICQQLIRLQIITWRPVLPTAPQLFEVNILS